MSNRLLWDTNSRCVYLLPLTCLFLWALLGWKRGADVLRASCGIQGLVEFVGWLLNLLNSVHEHILYVGIHFISFFIFVHVIKRKILILLIIIFVLGILLSRLEALFDCFKVIVFLIWFCHLNLLIYISERFEIILTGCPTSSSWVVICKVVYDLLSLKCKRLFYWSLWRVSGNNSFSPQKVFQVRILFFLSHEFYDLMERLSSFLNFVHDRSLLFHKRVSLNFGALDFIFDLLLVKLLFWHLLV